MRRVERDVDAARLIGHALQMLVHGLLVESIDLRRHLWFLSPITASSVVDVIPASVLISPPDVPGSASGFG
jgi:hypothetical protein